MQKADWKQKMTNLLTSKGWDYKDWHRVVSLEQYRLEEMMQMDLSEADESLLNELYNDTKRGKLNPNLLRFDNPVIIAVWTNKGGTGKSTTAINLSYELSLRQYNVLVIDTDSQSDTTSVIYPDYLDYPEKNFYYAFISQEDFKEEDYIFHTDYPNLDIIAGSQESESLEGTLSTMNDKVRDKIWRKCLRSIMADNYYDFIIIDMDKSSGLINKSILNEADFILSPVESAMFAIKSVPPVLSQVEEISKTNPKIRLLGILYNKVDMRKKNATADNMDTIQKLAPDAAFEVYIKNDANVDNSQKEHMPLGYYNRKSPASIQTIAFTDEVLTRIKKYMSERMV